MKVFKFGGASVKTADAVKNVKYIVDRYQHDDLFVVISAMGKTTNAMESIVSALYDQNDALFLELVADRKDFHWSILDALFDDHNHPVFAETNALFDELIALKEERMVENYNFQYDQIVAFGEILSTKIVSAYLASFRDDVCWKDARTFIRTNDNYRAAEVEWEKTKEMIDEVVQSNKCKVLITQGFIGHTKEGITTTLGREGSDFTAAILAFCTNAESVTIWKDVPGMLNADPRWFDHTEKLDSISYREAIELSYFGASVIHPKTIKPLQNKGIRLFVKSFIDPEGAGTIIQESIENDHLIPSFIFKINQVLMTITPKDFSFIMEDNLSDIFKNISRSGGHINIMQNSAVSFTGCLDIDPLQLNKLVDLLSDDYSVKYNNDLELVTIRYFDQETIDRVTEGREMLMEQKTRQTARIVMKKIER